MTENTDNVATFQKIGIPRNKPLQNPVMQQALQNANVKDRVKIDKQIVERAMLAKRNRAVTEIPIFLNHKQNAKNIVGWIRVENHVMVVHFERGFEPSLEKMQDLFGCVAGNVMEWAEPMANEEPKTRIKKFHVMSWGWK